MQAVTVKLKGIHQELTSLADLNRDIIQIDNMDYQIDQLPFDIPEIKTVYGTLLNYRKAQEALKPEMDEDPYKKPPEAPILYVKPQNTLISTQKSIPLPEGTEILQSGAALAIVIGKTATKVKEASALDFVAGYTIANDVSIPHNNFHRPVVNKTGRDGFCPVGPWIVSQESIENPNSLSIRVLVNNEVRQENNTKNLVRSVETLLQDVTEFMTLYKGDVLLVGVPENPPELSANDLVQVEIEGIGMIANRVVPEKAVLGGDNV